MNVSSSTTTLTKTTDTSAYASGDLVANSTTAGSVGALTFSAASNGPARGFAVTRVRLSKSSVGVTNAAFRLHLFSAVPTFTVGGDNSTVAAVVRGRANWLGSFDIASMIAFEDGAVGQGIPVAGTEVSATTGNTLDLYGILEARGAYAGSTSDVFTVTLEIVWLQ